MGTQTSLIHGTHVDAVTRRDGPLREDAVLSLYETVHPYTAMRRCGDAVMRRSDRGQM